MQETYQLPLSAQDRDDIVEAIERARNDLGEYLDEGWAERKTPDSIAVAEKLKRWEGLASRLRPSSLLAEKTCPEDAKRATYINVEHEFPAGASGLIELPAGKTWADVESWYVKYGTLHYWLIGDKQVREVELGYIDPATVDQKHPSRAAVYLANEDGDRIGCHPIEWK